MLPKNSTEACFLLKQAWQIISLILLIGYFKMGKQRQNYSTKEMQRQEDESQ